MKQTFFAVLAIAALMVSCQKENGNNNSLDNENDDRQLVVFGTNLKNDLSTKASINNVLEWNNELDSIFVYGINNNPDVTGDAKLFINNIPAKPEPNATPDTLKGKISLIDNSKNPARPFYYGTAEKDQYSFYAYYLGYLQTPSPAPTYDSQNDSIYLDEVMVLGHNDIMIGATNKTADAILGNGTMINPKYVYSEYSARHGVVPNLVFSHQLSKFVFEVKYGSTFDANVNQMNLDSLSLDSQTEGTLVIAGKQTGFIPSGDRSDVVLQMAESQIVDSLYARVGESLMIVPAGADSINLNVYFKETFFKDSTAKFSQNFVLPKVIKPSDVKDASGNPASAFEAGKQYLVRITVYGLEAVKVDIELRQWEEAGTVTVDPDQKEDGIIEGTVVCATGPDPATTVVYLQILQQDTTQGIQVGDVVQNVLDSTTPADGKYTLTPAVTVKSVTINSITVTSGAISAINS